MFCILFSCFNNNILKIQFKNINIIIIITKISFKNFNVERQSLRTKKEIFASSENWKKFENAKIVILNDRFINNQFVITNNQQLKFKIVWYFLKNANEHWAIIKKKWKFDIKIKKLHECCEIRRRINRDVKACRKTRREILQFEDD